MLQDSSDINASLWLVDKRLLIEKVLIVYGFDQLDTYLLIL